MIKAVIKKYNQSILQITVSGHAQSAEYGKDLICAAVSAILTGGFNAFNENDINECSLKEGYASVNVISQRGLVILETIIVQLKTIENQYPKNIKIK